MPSGCCTRVENLLAGWFCMERVVFSCLTAQIPVLVLDLGRVDADTCSSVNPQQVTTLYKMIRKLWWDRALRC